MVARAEWFGRQFNFDLPAWMYPNVVERVRGTPARLEERLRDIPRASLTRRDGARWSMQEHAGHLLDLEALGLTRLEEFRAGRERLSAADVENRKTYEADHNARAVEGILTSFRAERAEFVRQLDGFDEEFVQRTALHPRLNQPMRVIDLAFFVAEHDDHHLAAITELIRKFA